MGRLLVLGPLIAILLGCSSGQKVASPSHEQPVGARGSREAPRAPQPAPPPLPAGAQNSELAKLYAEELARRPELTFAELKAEIRLRRAPDAKLSFDPTTAQHFDLVSSQLQLTTKERSLFRERGFVSVDHRQRYSMASLYYAIYARDLPLLVTTDSVLHALHRSYDEILKHLETGLFTPVIGRVLEATQQEAKRALGAAPPPEVRTALSDVDLYLTVGRNFLAGAGSSSEPAWAHFDKWDGKLVVPSVAGRDGEALALLRRAATLSLETPAAFCASCTQIYGGVRPIDWSQLRPRGHYEHGELRRYFRTLMWLGRADLGFHLTSPAPVSGLRVDAARERGAAATLALLLRRSGELGRLQAMSRIIDFMVGRGDDVSVQELLAMLDQAGADLGTLGEPATVEKLANAVDKAKKQQIRSQTLGSSVAGTQETALPVVFQMFGQRFLADSYVLSRVVFDSIVYQGEKQMRMLPRGLDVMAALGNDEAVALLEPDLTQYKYAANLLAARRALSRQGDDGWNGSAYAMWLDSLRTLDDPLPSAAKAPEVMKTQAWQRKMLQTQHASWAELRHDTLLYGKQSYTAYPVCGYPDAYVEPYPELYMRVAALVRRLERDLGAADLDHPEAAIKNSMQAVRQHQVAFLSGFGRVMDQLTALAKKALEGRAFSATELDFLKKTIDIRGGGSGPPTYSGWYLDLFYDRQPADWKPTIADVHTNPVNNEVLEVAVGDATFLVLAVDAKACGKKNSVYVGPAYTYYEFTEPAPRRMTDTEWQQRISENKLPQRPQWVQSFVAPATQRHLASPPQRAR